MQITIAAAVILDGRRMLVVRKHGSAVFMQPGGKLEPGEAPAAALCRELAEEIAISLEPEAFFELGVFSAPAANEPGAMVVAHVFAARTHGEPVAQAEIAELAWVDLDAPDGLPLAQLSAEHVVPLARRLAGGSP